MRYGVDTRCCRKTLRSIHHNVCVDYSHVWHKFIVCKRIFYACLFIGDNGKRRNFGTCTCRRRNCNEKCFFAHFREGINSLSDIHKTHCKIHEVYFRMFVKYPHDFAGVHSGTTAQSNNAIRLERFHLFRTFFCACKSRVRSYVKERSMLNAHFVKFVGNRLCISIVIQETVCNDKCFFLAHNGL